jgi:hypothetical protein
MKSAFFKKLFSGLTLVAFLFLNVGSSPAQEVLSRGLELPAPGSIVNLSASYVPPVLKGIRVDPKQPFQFEFILDTGNSDPADKDLANEAATLIRYFLASLTIPEEDLWVNLSPYEKDRIIPDEFSLTEMGRDLLSQDYLLKQITASLIDPGSATGREFWDQVYKKAFETFGSTDIPLDTFNKVWVVPAKAVIYENGPRAFVVEAKLKVMLESDYFAQNEGRKDEGTINGRSSQRSSIVPASPSGGQRPSSNGDTQNFAKDVLRQVVIPILEKEVNEGKNFAQLRQVFHSLILARWFKDNLKESLLNRKYADQSKVNGVDLADPGAKVAIYNQYLQAFQKGVFNFVKEEYDANAQELVPRKYFSGGFDLAMSLKIEKTSRLPDQTQDIDGTAVVVTGQFNRPEVSVPDLEALNTELALDPGLDVSRDAAMNETPAGTTVTIEKRQTNTRALAERLIRQEDQALKLQGILTSQLVTTEDIKRIVEQLGRADFLSRILEITPGDWIVQFRRPGMTAKGTGIKDLNDIFGPEGNNRIIHETRLAIEKQMNRRGFYSTYKESGFTVAKSEIASLRQQLPEILFAVSRQVIDFISKDSGLKEKWDANFGPEETLALDYGLSQVEDVTGNEEAKAKSKVISFMKAGMAIALSRSGLFAPEEAPAVFKAENLLKTVRQSEMLRKQLQNTDIFTPYDGTEYRVLRDNISRVLRQQLAWEQVSPEDQKYFRPTVGSEREAQENYEKARQYFDLLAVVDFIKQWQVNFSDALWRSRLVLSMKKGLQEFVDSYGPGEKIEVGALLKYYFITAQNLIEYDSKFLEANSELSFYAHAPAHKKLGFIAVDIVNMGGKNVKEFEVLMQKLAELPAEAVSRFGDLGADDRVSELMMSSADRVTEDFQARIKLVKEYLSEEFARDQGLRKEDVYIVFIRMGGDEIAIGMDNYDGITPERILKIQELTQGRVAGTQAIGKLRENFAKRRSFVLNGRAVANSEEVTHKMALAALLLQMEKVLSGIKKGGDSKVVVIGSDAEETEYTIGEGPAQGQTVDHATAQPADIYGGIDLDPAQWGLETRGQGLNWEWPADTRDLDNLEINGLVPVIFQIAPATDLPQFLGVSSAAALEQPVAT